MTTWFTSDLHFGHKNIIKYCNRPWATAAEMDAALIANRNAVVKPDDDVWNLGDVAFTCAPSHALNCLKQLNGRHHIVKGNHDEVLLKLRGSAGWAFDIGSFSDGYVEIEVEGQGVVLCHYAMREWNHALRGVWHLFGHTHAGLRPFGKSVDVGVDNTYEVLTGRPLQAATETLIGEAVIEAHRAFRRALYRPVSFAEVKKFMDAQPIGPHPAFAGGFKEGQNA